MVGRGRDVHMQGKLPVELAPLPLMYPQITPSMENSGNADGEYSIKKPEGDTVEK